MSSSRENRLGTLRRFLTFARFPAPLLLALPLLLVAAATGLGFAPQTDELKFHLGVVQQFGQALPAIPWRDYHAATPPLPYLLWALWAKLFGYGLPALRLLTLLLSYAGILAFWDLARRRGHPAPLLEAMLLLFSPYLFLNSFTLYTVNVGLPFEVLALRFYLEADRTGWKGLLWGGLAAAVAVYCRQHYLFLPAGMGLYWLWRTLRDWRTLRRFQTFARFALIALPALLFAPLALAWGGLTPPAFQQLHTLRANVQNVNFLLMLVGLYCAPLALLAWPNIARCGWRAGALLLGLPLYVAFRPDYGEAADAQAGIILHGLDILRRLAGPLVAGAGQVALWANGLVILAAAGGRLPEARRAGAAREPLLLCAWMLAFAVILLASDAVYERFYALIVPVLLLLLYPWAARRRIVLALWLGLSAGMSVAYLMLKA